MRRTYAPAVFLAVTTFVACSTPAPTAPTSRAAPRLAEVLRAGAPAGSVLPPLRSGAGGGPPPSRSSLEDDLRGRGPSLAAPGAASPFGERSFPTLAASGPGGANGGGVPPATPSPEPSAASAVPSDDPACRDARARRGEVASRLAEVRKTSGVAEARALDRASAALAACEARQDCVEGDPKERAARVMAVEEARAVFRTASAGLQSEELGLFEADRAVRAACGSAP